MSEPEEKMLQKRWYRPHIVIRSIVVSDVYWKPNNGKRGCHGDFSQMFSSLVFIPIGSVSRYFS